VAPRFALTWLLAAGAVLLLGGLAGITAGTCCAAQLHAMLPPVVIDAAAVGGAATASGTALLFLGAIHLGAALLLRRAMAAAVTAAVVLATLMGLLCLGWAVAALVSVVSGAGPAVTLLPAGIGLGAVTIGYGWSARSLLRLREAPDSRS
jgi:hypothetical protein